MWASLLIFLLHAEVIIVYIYPDNLKSKAVLWLWELLSLAWAP